MASAAARTMFEKIWARHVVSEGPGGHVLLYVGRHLLHEGSTAAFARLAAAGRRVRRAGLPVAAAGPLPPAAPGAFGALAFGIGSTEVEHGLATQTLWQQKPRVMRITVEGRLGPGVTAKDLILAIIERIGAAGRGGDASGDAGSAIRALSMDERMTVCNMSIEAGARTGMVAPDETTFAWLEGRPFAPRGAGWARALADWRAGAGGPGARFDREVPLAAGDVEPTVTWGTSPQDALPITGRGPDPAAAGGPARRAPQARGVACRGGPRGP